MEILYEMPSETFSWDFSKNEPACVSVCLNLYPKNGTVGTRGESLFLHIL